MISATNERWQRHGTASHDRGAVSRLVRMSAASASRNSGSYIIGKAPKTSVLPTGLGESWVTPCRPAPSDAILRCRALRPLAKGALNCGLWPDRGSCG
jgi:hypothetical protein